MICQREIFFNEFVVGWKSFRHNPQRSCTENCFKKKKGFVRVSFASQLLLRVFGMIVKKKTRNQGNVKNKKKSIVITTRDERGRDFFLFVSYLKPDIITEQYPTQIRTACLNFLKNKKTSKGEAGRRLNNK